MPLSEQDDDFIENSLETLCKALVPPSDPAYGQINEFIYVHEFGLALDELAYIQLQSDVPPSAETRALFEALAQKMDMKDGDMWVSVAKLRKA